jgi:hypothetical protein
MCNERAVGSGASEDRLDRLITDGFSFAQLDDPPPGADSVYSVEYPL